MVFCPLVYGTVYLNCLLIDLRKRGFHVQAYSDDVATLGYWHQYAKDQR